MKIMKIFHYENLELYGSLYCSVIVIYFRNNFNLDEIEGTLFLNLKVIQNALYN